MEAPARAPERAVNRNQASVHEQLIADGRCGSVLHVVQAVDAGCGRAEGVLDCSQRVREVVRVVDDAVPGIPWFVVKEENIDARYTRSSQTMERAISSQATSNPFFLLTVDEFGLSCQPFFSVSTRQAVGVYKLDHHALRTCCTARTSSLH